MPRSSIQWMLAPAFAAALALGGCGGSSSGGSGGGSSNSGGTGPAPTYTVGGSVTGLASGQSVALLDNGGSALTLSTNGTFSFPGGLASGSSYAVTIGTQPTGESCSVAQGSGTIGAAAITNVAITCQSVKYTVGGTISGLGSSGLVLVNGSDTLSVPANATNFTMPTAVANGSSYDVTATTHPVATNCSVVDGVGSVSGADVTDISISCQPGAESLLYSFAGGTTDGAAPYGSLIHASDGDFYGMTSYGGAQGDGVVFKITPSGTETVLHSFAGGSTDGANPQGSLKQASDGDFYGMTSYGGASNAGTVFKITPSGTETVLYSFLGGTLDGSTPSGSLIQASDGNFYGMTWSGGSQGVGIVFRITSGGTETVLHSFTGATTDGSYPTDSLMQASDGNLYGMTDEGGTSNVGTVFKITPSGAETVLHSFAGGSADGSDPGGNLIQASDGNFYGMTDEGGTNNVGTVFKITPSGTESVLYSFAGGSTDAGDPTGSLIQASDGDFYGTTLGGGTQTEGTVFRITSGGTESVLYSFLGGTTDGSAPKGNLIQSSDGNLYGLASGGGSQSDGIVFVLN